MTGHDLDLEACKRIPHPVAKVLVAEVESLRAKLAAAGQEREAADKEWRNVNFQSIELIRQQRERADRAETVLGAVRELHRENPGAIKVCVHCGGNWPCDTDRILAAVEQPEPERTERDEVIANFQRGAKAVCTTRGPVTSVEQYDAAEQPEPTLEQP